MEVVLGNIYIRQVPEPLEKGEIVEGHTHNFDHVTYVNKGSFKITRTSPDGETKSRTIHATDEYNFVMILATHNHTLEALEDDSVYHCVYAHRNPITKEVQEHYTGWDEAYR